MWLLVHMSFSVAFRVQFRECRNYCVGIATLKLWPISFHLFVSVCSFLCFSHLAGAQFADCIDCLIHCQVQITPCTQFVHSRQCLDFSHTWLAHFSSIGALNIYSEYLLCLVFEYSLHLFIIYQTIRTHHHELANNQSSFSLSHSPSLS